MKPWLHWILLFPVTFWSAEALPHDEWTEMPLTADYTASAADILGHTYFLCTPQSSELRVSLPSNPPDGAVALYKVDNLPSGGCSFVMHDGTNIVGNWPKLLIQMGLGSIELMTKGGEYIVTSHSTYPRYANSGAHRTFVANASNFFTATVPDNWRGALVRVSGKEAESNNIQIWLPLLEDISGGSNYGSGFEVCFIFVDQQHPQQSVTIQPQLSSGDSIQRTGTGGAVYLTEDLHYMCVDRQGGNPAEWFITKEHKPS